MQKYFVVAIAIAAVCIARTFFILRMTCTIGLEGLEIAESWNTRLDEDEGNRRHR